MQRFLVAIVALSCVLASGCTTPTTIKDASTKHASNLTGLQQAVAEYRRKLDDYFDRLIQQQREAHIAKYVNQRIHAIAERQAASIASQMRKEPKSEQPAKDFIKAGTDVMNDFVFSRKMFDRWVEKTPGNDLNARRANMKAEMEKKAKATDPPNADLLEKAQNLPDDEELTFVLNAIGLRQQRALLDTQLDLLAAQVTTMQAFHAKVNEFLAIDATIDGARIASAAAAGSKADFTGILGKK